MKPSIFSLTQNEIISQLQEMREPRFRAKQIQHWLYEKCVQNFSEMKNLSLELREKLEDTFTLSPIDCVKKEESKDQETTKFLWKLHDGYYVESVLIRSGQRKTVCVSSQVGCPGRCAFCASGKKGWIRHLNVEEIIAQVQFIKNYEEVSHIVFMGMGEPMDNLDAVLSAVKVFHKEMGISQRRITISTVGVIEGIERLSDEEIKVNLVLSLHAPEQKLRERIIPYARKYNLDPLLEAMHKYYQKSGRDITYEYTLIEGFNDQEEHAHNLAKKLKRSHCTVNLIPYNPVEGLKFKRPSKNAIDRFRKILNKEKIINTCRYTKGDDIAAACGQLAIMEKEKQNQE